MPTAKVPMLSEEEVKKRVAKGVKWLDETMPSWWKKIVGKLDMGWCESCILGKLFKDYTNIVQFNNGHPDPERHRWAKQRGFDLEDKEGYPELTKEWKRVIAEKKEKANV